MSPVKTTAPANWSRKISPEGALQISCAMEAGTGRNVLLASGSVFSLLGILGLAWLLTTDVPLTLEGCVTLLVPVGVILCGAYAFDTALVARSQYLLGATRFAAKKISFFRPRSRTIARQSIVAIRQKYSPPDPAAPAHTPGDWVTFLVYALDDRTTGELPLDGVHTAEEAQWLAEELVQWAGVPVERCFSEESAENDPATLPQLPPPGK